MAKEISSARSVLLAPLRARDWLLPQEAVQYVSLACDAPVDVVYLWRAVREGKLRVAIEFTRPKFGRRARHVSGEEECASAGEPVFKGIEYEEPVNPRLYPQDWERWFLCELQSAGDDSRLRALADGRLVALLDEIVEISKPSLLVLAGDGPTIVENLLRSATGEARVELDRARGVLLEVDGLDGECNVVELLHRGADNRLCTCIGLPDDSRVVFRPADLESFLSDCLAVYSPKRKLSHETTLALLGILIEKYVPKKGGLDQLGQQLAELEIRGISDRNADAYFAEAAEILAIRRGPPK